MPRHQRISLYRRRHFKPGKVQRRPQHSRRTCSLVPGFFDAPHRMARHLSVRIAKRLDGLAQTIFQYALAIEDLSPLVLPRELIQAAVRNRMAPDLKLFCSHLTHLLNCELASRFESIDRDIE